MVLFRVMGPSTGRPDAREDEDLSRISRLGTGFAPLSDQSPFFPIRDV